MLVRRCAILVVEPREELEFDLSVLFAGEQALAARVAWLALAAHLPEEVPLEPGDLELLGAVGESLWQERAPLDARYGRERLERLLGAGLLVSDDPAHAGHRERDERIRETHWFGPSALAHFHGRWRGRNVSEDPRLSGFETIADMVAAYGAPPPEVAERADSAERLLLPPPAEGALDAALLARYTGRNYDPEAVLPLALVSRLLQRGFGAQQVREVAPGTVAFKKTSPSGGSLHPVGAYVITRRVEGVPPGVWHYHPVAHALEPVAPLDAATAPGLLRRCLADQHWFADAPLMVVLAARFRRNFWKYRNHAKAYRALVLDAGHLSQTFYLLAAEAGLPAFVTAAVDDGELETLLRIDPLQEGVLAVCGCGLPSGKEETVEFRPEGRIAGMAR